MYLPTHIFITKSSQVGTIHTALKSSLSGDIKSVGYIWTVTGWNRVQSPGQCWENSPI